MFVYLYVLVYRFVVCIVQYSLSFAIYREANAHPRQYAKLQSYFERESSDSLSESESHTTPSAAAAAAAAAASDVIDIASQPPLAVTTSPTGHSFESKPAPRRSNKHHSRQSYLSAQSQQSQLSAPSTTSATTSPAAAGPADAATATTATAAAAVESERVLSPRAAAAVAKDSALARRLRRKQSNLNDPRFFNLSRVWGFCCLVFWILLLFACSFFVFVCLFVLSHCSPAR